MRVLVQPPSYDGEKRFDDRVLIAPPPPGQLAVMRAWLDQNLGAGSWASASAGFDGVVNDAIAFYFAEPADARAFINRFGCGYWAMSSSDVRTG